MLEEEGEPLEDLSAGPLVAKNKRATDENGSTEATTCPLHGAQVA